MKIWIANITMNLQMNYPVSYKTFNEKDYNQSTEQAFTSLKDIENIEVGDMVSAYCNDIKVGSREWNGSYTDIPAMGNDNSDLTKDYCTSNQVPDI